MKKSKSKNTSKSQSKLTNNAPSRSRTA